MDIYVINGANLNLLGQRDPEIYGRENLEDLTQYIHRICKQLKLTVTTLQSNHEGELIEWIQEAGENAKGLVINPAAHTHYSFAIKDALSCITIPKVEVHISNIYKRESFRHHSVTADACDGQISGFGFYGYEMGIHYLASKF